MGDSVGEFPFNFSWVIEDELCALGFPDTPGNMQYLVNNNVGYLVSLTAERRPDIQGYEKDLHLTCIKIVDFTPPTLQQAEVFLQMMEKARRNKKAVAIHCAHGKGRTGTMAACYLIKEYGYTTRQAIDKIRQIRPGSIETRDQELFVHQFEEYQNTC